MEQSVEFFLGLLIICMLWKCILIHWKTNCRWNTLEDCTKIEGFPINLQRTTCAFPFNSDKLSPGNLIAAHWRKPIRSSSTRSTSRKHTCIPQSSSHSSKTFNLGNVTICRQSLNVMTVTIEASVYWSAASTTPSWSHSIKSKTLLCASIMSCARWIKIKWKVIWINRRFAGKTINYEHAIAKRISTQIFSRKPAKNAWATTS